MLDYFVDTKSMRMAMEEVLMRNDNGKIKDASRHVNTIFQTLFVSYNLGEKGYANKSCGYNEPIDVLFVNELHIRRQSQTHIRIDKETQDS